MTMEGSEMAQAQAGAQAVREMWAALRPGGDLGAIERLVTADYVRHTAGGGHHDRAEFIATMSALHAAFPDLETRIDDLVADADRVAYRWTSTGLHSGDYLGVPPTQRRITATGITFARIVDGRIAEEWTSWNKTSVLHRLGIFPLDP